MLKTIYFKMLLPSTVPMATNSCNQWYAHLQITIALRAYAFPMGNDCASRKRQVDLDMPSPSIPSLYCCLHALASLGQMFFGISGRSHLFREQGTKATAIRRVDSDIGPPFRHVMGRVLGHTTSQAGRVLKQVSDPKWLASC
jgi:hypothetical protein